MTTEIAPELKIGFSPIPFNELVENLCREKLPEIPSDYLRDAIEKKLILLFGVYGNEKFLGCFFTRVERLINGEMEVVILYTVSAYNTGVKMSSLITPIYEELARNAGIKSVRIHSSQKSIDNFLVNAGFHEMERVFRKVL